MDKCNLLHSEIIKLPFIQYPFNLNDLPYNGIYFFYEYGEKCNHDKGLDRIVRIGTHKNNNFRNRISSHFLLNENKMNFNKMKPAPKDRSIFRKNIGRALLNKKNDDYLKIWDIDFTSRSIREEFGELRDVEKEKNIEFEITNLIRNNFYFRFIIINKQEDRMGSSGLESSLIATVAKCGVCKPSNNWLGRYSPKNEISSIGLWQSQHLKTQVLNNHEIDLFLDAIRKTKNWIGG